MGEKTGIGWCHHTFNIAWGCQMVSPGCEHCYAKTLAERHGHFVWGPPRHSPRRLFGDKHWAEPLAWNRSAERAGERRRVFCSSMADVFEAHPALDSERLKLWALIEATPWLDWLLLTKRPENIRAMLPAEWLVTPRPNVWLLTSAEDQRRAEERIGHLLAVPAVVHGLSAEPLLGPMVIERWLLPHWEDHANVRRDTPPDRPRLDWVIVGGESGPGFRPMDLDWARDLRQQCLSTGVAFFFKQQSAFRSGQNPTLDGETWHMFPVPRAGDTVQQLSLV